MELLLRNMGSRGEVPWRVWDRSLPRPVGESGRRSVGNRKERDTRDYASSPERQPKDKGGKRMILKNAVIHDGLGRAFTGDLRIEDGLIAEVAAHIEGEGTDLAGAHVLPGFIDTLSKWGINGTAYEIRPSSDDNDEKSDPVTP